jgi:predicted AAA+ superfamily ATPase
VSGQLYETMVVSEIVKWMRTHNKDAELFFYRTRSGMEVDLLIETPAGIICMEIKSRATANNRNTRSMRSLAQKLDKQWLGGMVIYTGKEVKPIVEPDIWAVPSHRLFQPFESSDSQMPAMRRPQF